MAMDTNDYNLVRQIDARLATRVSQSESMMALMKSQLEVSEKQLAMTQKIYQHVSRPTLTGPDYDVFQRRE